MKYRQFIRELFCKHKWFISLYTDYEFYHCSKCGKYEYIEPKDRYKRL